MLKSLLTSCVTLKEQIKSCALTCWTLFCIFSRRVLVRIFNVGYTQYLAKDLLDIQQQSLTNQSTQDKIKV